MAEEGVCTPSFRLLFVVLLVPLPGEGPGPALVVQSVPGTAPRGPHHAHADNGCDDKNANQEPDHVQSPPIGLQTASSLPRQAAGESGYFVGFSRKAPSWCHHSSGSKPTRQMAIPFRLYW